MDEKVSIGGVWQLLLGTLLSMVSLALGISNIITYYSEDYRRFLASDDEGSLFGIVLFMAVAFGIMYLVENHLDYCRDYSKVSGSVLDAYDLLRYVTWGTCAFPIYRLVLWGIKWLVYWVCTWFVSGNDYSWCDNVKAFMESKKFLAAADILLVGVLLYFLVLIPIYELARDKMRRDKFARGKGYALPHSYAGGLKDFKNSDEFFFIDDRHRLLWIKKTIDLGLENIRKNPASAAWVPSSGDGYFSADEAICAGVKFWDIFELCRTAIKDSREKDDIKDTVLYYEDLTEICLTFAKYGALPAISERVLKEIGNIYDQLIQIYRSGAGNVAASTEKALDYLADKENFVKLAAQCAAREKEIQKKVHAEFKARRKSENSSNLMPDVSPANMGEKPVKDYGAENNNVFSFPRYIYDYDENPWELVNSGVDNANYYCQKTGVYQSFHSSEFEYGSPTGFHLRT